MAIESVFRATAPQEPLRVKNVSGQAVIIGKPESKKKAISADPAVLLEARRSAHEKAVEAVMANRKQLLIEFGL